MNEANKIWKVISIDRKFVIARILYSKNSKKRERRQAIKDLLKEVNKETKK